MDTILKNGPEIVPVVFITNRVFLKHNDSLPIYLAKKVASKIRQICDKNNIQSVKEIQIDCDWTLKTREAYFKFLKLLKSEFSAPELKLSATIRLHQVKFPQKTGVPPVDRGMLMFYNMGDINDPKTVNSILDIDKAKKYLDYIYEYPLQFDIALPLFSWGVLFRRGRVIDLVNNIDVNDISKNQQFIKIHKNIYRSNSNHYFMNHYFYKNDVIRIEETNFEELKKAAKILSRHIHSDQFTLAFYHFDSANTKKYSNEDLRHIINIFD
jgi:hypothetical protein